MIYKVENNNAWYAGDKGTYYNLKIVDKLGKSFTMMIGGNLDLYWIPENYKETKSYTIDRSDTLLFDLFCQLFQAIAKNDDQYHPTLDRNVFTFISEDFPEEFANTLKITRSKESFIIDFIRHDKESPYGMFRRGCPICFCNSGSRVPKVEQLFSIMFNYIAYQCPEIELEK